jgi:hypothetical protein
MANPLVVDVLRDQLLQMLTWYQHRDLTYNWGVVLHRRNERGHLRFGAVTPAGESFLVSEALLGRLHGLSCWLDGIVPVQFETRQLSDADVTTESDTMLSTPMLSTARPRFVEALAVHFDAAAAMNEPEAQSFLPVAGVVTPATLPSELFVLTRERPAGWPL